MVLTFMCIALALHVYLLLYIVYDAAYETRLSLDILWQRGLLILTGGVCDWQTEPYLSCKRNYGWLKIYVAAEQALA